MIAKAEETPTFLDTDWPNWRGPTHNGIAPERQNPPTQFSTTQNVIWKAPVPGLGHGTPIVVRDKVVLLTADQKAKHSSLSPMNEVLENNLAKGDSQGWLHATQQKGLTSQRFPLL